MVGDLEPEPYRCSTLIVVRVLLTSVLKTMAKESKKEIIYKFYVEKLLF